MSSSSALGLVVLRVVASDKDAGDNGRLEYILRGVTQEVEYFSMDNVTGELSVAKSQSDLRSNLQVKGRGS